MSSIKERMECVPSITVAHDGEFCLKVTHKGDEIGKILIGIKSVTRNIANEECSIEIWTLNPKAIGDKITLTEYLND